MTHQPTHQTRQRLAGRLKPIDLDLATAARRDLLTYLRTRDKEYAAMTPTQRAVHKLKALARATINRFSPS